MDKTAISMRDFFFDKLCDIARDNKKIVIVSADMNAPALDKRIKELGNQYINTGIAEQGALLVASGLALAGKKPYVYAIAPFVTTRIHEFIKLEMGVMKLPITVVGVGAGFSYDEAGPTHHTTEDISIIRAIPNLAIFSPSDAEMAKSFALLTSVMKTPAYIRLDRQLLPQIYGSAENFIDGYCSLKDGKDIAIIATASMVHNAIEASDYLAKENGASIGVIDLYRPQPLNPELVNILRRYKQVITVEEHMLNGGLGSIISELITDNQLNTKLKRIGLDKYHYLYGTRGNIQNSTGLGVEDIVKTIKTYL